MDAASRRLDDGRIRPTLSGVVARTGLLIAAFVVWSWCVLVVSLNCDDACGGPGGRWHEDPHAWQDAGMAILGSAVLGLAILTAVLGRRRRVWPVLLACTLTNAAFIGYGFGEGFYGVPVLVSALAAIWAATGLLLLRPPPARA